MAFTAASSNLTALRYVKETVFGTTPSTPALQELRFTGESLNFNITNTTSNEIRSDRMTSDTVQTSADTSGDIQIELSSGSYDDFMVSAVGATDWSAAITITPSTIAAAGTTNRYTLGSGVTTGVVAGQWIKLGGFANDANNGYKQVKTVVSSTVLEVYQALTTESAVSGATIVVGRYIRNGATYSSFTIQKDLNIDGTNHAYFNFKGMRVGQLSLSFSTGAILTGSFSFMGLAQTTSTSQIAGATTVAATSTNVMNSVGNISSIWFDDTIATSSFQSLSMDINGTLRAQDAIGSLGHVGIALGRMAISGAITVYFSDTTQYNKFLNATEFKYSMVVEDAVGKSYIFTIPRVKYTSGTVTAGGLDQDVTMQANWESLKDVTYGIMVQIDRF